MAEFVRKTHPLFGGMTVKELRWVVSEVPDDAVISIDTSGSDPVLVVDPAR